MSGVGAFSVCLILALSTGCSKPPAPPHAAPGAQATPGAPSESAPSESVPSGQTAPPDEIAPAEAADTPTQEPLSEEDAAKLETAFRAVWCGLSKRQREGLQAVYEANGFRDAADFASRWSEARQQDPDWAAAIMAQVAAGSCATDG